MQSGRQCIWFLDRVWSECSAAGYTAVRFHGYTTRQPVALHRRFTFHSPALPVGLQERPKAGLPVMNVQELSTLYMFWMLSMFRYSIVCVHLCSSASSPRRLRYPGFASSGGLVLSYVSCFFVWPRLLLLQERPRKSRLSCSLAVSFAMISRSVKHPNPFLRYRLKHFRIYQYLIHWSASVISVGRVPEYWLNTKKSAKAKAGNRGDLIPRGWKWHEWNG